jgi:hypothetical protein
MNLADSGRAIRKKRNAETVILAKMRNVETDSVGSPVEAVQRSSASKVILHPDITNTAERLDFLKDRPPDTFAIEL